MFSSVPDSNHHHEKLKKKNSVNMHSTVHVTHFPNGKDQEDGLAIGKERTVAGSIHALSFAYSYTRKSGKVPPLHGKDR